MLKAKRFAALMLALALLLPSCGSKTAATTMRLKKTEGTVGVSDGGGKNVEPREDLGLYSGYGVDTKSESYAWIDLDEVKLTKLDQDSEIEITKEGKHLEIVVNSGSLFFNVTQPLEEDETMEIRTSSMVVGIRGTCGWVEVPDEEHMNVYLLEGKVECAAGEETAAVAAGEMGAITADGEITVAPFTSAEIPAFVREELGENQELMERVQEDSGLDPSAEAPADQPKPIRAITYDADGTLNGRTDYTYDEQGNVIGYTAYYWDNGTWTYSGYGEHVLNAQGIATEIRGYDSQGELTQIDTLIESAEGHEVYRSEMYTGDNGSQTYTTESTTYYNEQGQEVRTVTNYGYDLYEYDSEGKLIQINDYQSNGTLQCYTVFEYES